MALRAARERNWLRPSLILARTHIGYGAPDKQDSFESHGSPLGVDEVRLAKQNSGLADRAAILHPREGGRTFSQGDRAWKVGRDGVER